jgi:hypothetical protein
MRGRDGPGYVEARGRRGDRRHPAVDHPGSHHAQPPAEVAEATGTGTEDRGDADGYDGVVNDYFLVRTTRFDPRGALSDDELAGEHISGMRWWRHRDIAEYGGTDLFSPRDIATPLAALLGGDIPDTPVMLGL